VIKAVQAWPKCHQVGAGTALAYTRWTP